MIRRREYVRAAWALRGVFGWQDWCCSADRVAMVLEWRMSRAGMAGPA